MPELNSIARTVYLLCLTVTLIVAMISLLSGAGFEAMITRMALALVGSGVLGWAAILTLLPATASEGQAAVRDRPSAAVSASEPEQAGDDRPRPTDEAEEKAREMPASA